MNKRILTSLVAFACTAVLGVQAQSKDFIQHKVNRGENVTQIARQYSISVQEIFKYNPEAAQGIQENAFLLIPKAPTTASASTHVVLAKETLFGIAKQYQVSVEQLYWWNPGLKQNGLKAGDEIQLSAAGVDFVGEVKQQIVDLGVLPATTAESKAAIVSRTIGARETLYSIAVEHGTSIQKIFELNPELRNQDLHPGQAIRVPAIKSAASKTDVTSKSSQSDKQYREIIVEPKETLYNLTKQYNISPQDLLQLNPELADGLKVGMRLQVPAQDGEVVKPVAERKAELKPTSAKGFKDLSLSLDKKTSKELVLLLPFNVHKMGEDRNSWSDKFKKDSFLNMTFDFYSGALMAIDSAKALGLPLTVKIYDSKETSTTSDVKNIFASEDFSKTNVVVGPFFQKNVTDAAALMQESQMVLVSPLSTEKGKAHVNQVQTMPTADDLRAYLVDYLVGKKGNIVAVLDEKRTSSRKFLQQNYPSIKIVTGKEAATVAALLSKDKKNYVILDSGSIETALKTTQTLVSKLDQYQIQLATFDKNEVYDYSEISLASLTKLQLLYASVTRENETDNASQFARDYRQQNNIYPSRFATRGFDVTFDVITRMFQSSDFLSTTAAFSTEQVDNKFVYTQTSSGVYNSQGIYLLYYNEDLTVKAIK